MKLEKMLDVNKDFTGDAAVYKTSEPVEYVTWNVNCKQEVKTTSYVVASHVANGLINETMFFASTPTGGVLEWSELACLRNTTQEEAVEAVNKGMVTLGGYY